MPKAVCVRLGDRGELAACFNPETLCYEAVWQRRLRPVLRPRATACSTASSSTALPCPGPRGRSPIGRSSTTASIATATGSSSRTGSATSRCSTPPGSRTAGSPGSSRRPPSIRLRRLTQGGGPAQWPQVLTTRGTLGRSGPYAIDTIEPPFDNPWKAPALLRRPRLPPRRHGHALHDAGGRLARRGTRRHARARPLAPICLRAAPCARAWSSSRARFTSWAATRSPGSTISTATARPTSTSASATPTRPRRPATTSSAASQRDAAGRFYTASGKQGLLRIPADGRPGRGRWRPASATPTAWASPRTARSRSPAPRATGRRRRWSARSSRAATTAISGPRSGQPPDLPLVYLPRGLDNSSGGQVTVPGRPLRAARGPDAPLLVRHRARISCCCARRSTASRRARWCRCPASSSRACTAAASTPATGSSTSRA